MSNIARLTKALESGDVETLEELRCSGLDDGVRTAEEVRVALSRAADRVVFHRLNYREAVRRTVDLGVPCEVWTAARAGLVEHVERWLAGHPELLDAPDGQGRTPLQRSALVYGICEECEQVADVLIAKGANVDVFTAATLGLPDVVRREVGRKPNLVESRCQGSTPLNWAVRPRRNFSAAPEICQTLLDAGADTRDRDEDESGMTPLHHAAEWGAPICSTLVELLLDAGADVNCADDQGWTPLDYARDRGRKEMVEFLEARGGFREG